MKIVFFVVSRHITGLPSVDKSIEHITVTEKVIQKCHFFSRIRKKEIPLKIINILKLNIDIYLPCFIHG